MQLIRRLNSWNHSSPTVLTIGNFDGMHRGHQLMLAATCQAARQHGLPSTVVSFEPLPHEYFMGSEAPPRLQGLRDRFCSIARQQIDRLLLLQFDQSLATLPATDFIEHILSNTLHARHIIVGDDFRFGHQRLGDITLLQERGQQLGFTVEQSPTCQHEDERISSTRLRHSLQQGHLEQAKALLGRDYSISGRVIHGEKLGRQLGFPTANVRLGRYRPPLRGVFAVRVLHQQSGLRFDGVANLGERPTIGGRRLLLEVHALDTSPDWYGEHLQVNFIAQLRGERHFDSLGALQDQIKRDAEDARTLISTVSSTLDAVQDGRL